MHRWHNFFVKILHEAVEYASKMKPLLMCQCNNICERLALYLLWKCLEPRALHTALYQQSNHWALWEDTQVYESRLVLPLPAIWNSRCQESLFFLGEVCFRILTNQRRTHVLLQVPAKCCTLNAGLLPKWPVKAGCFSYLTFTHLLVAFIGKLVTSPLFPKTFWAHNDIFWYWVL